MVMPILFLSIASQAFSSHNENYREFDGDKISKINLNVDKSTIKFYTSDKFQIECHVIRINNNPHTSYKINDNILYINSTNPGQGGCEVDYKIGLPKAVDVTINGGYVDIDSNALFKSFSLSTGSIRANFMNPQCSMQVNSGYGNLDIAYNQIPVTPIEINSSMATGQLNLKIPDQATVGFKFMTACTYSNHLHSDFSNTNDDPNFIINFNTSAARLNILRHNKKENPGIQLFVRHFD